MSSTVDPEFEKFREKRESAKYDSKPLIERSSLGGDIQSVPDPDMSKTESPEVQTGLFFGKAPWQKKAEEAEEAKGRIKLDSLDLDAVKEGGGHAQVGETIKLIDIATGEAPGAKPPPRPAQRVVKPGAVVSQKPPGAVRPGAPPPRPGAPGAPRPGVPGASRPPAPPVGRPAAIVRPGASSVRPPAPAARPPARPGAPPPRDNPSHFSSTASGAAHAALGGAAPRPSPPRPAPPRPAPPAPKGKPPQAPPQSSKSKTGRRPKPPR